MNRTVFTNPMYVRTDNNLIYAVASATTYNHMDCDRIELDLELVCGWDYINPDWTNEQGWVGSEQFVEDVQTATEYQYYLTESARECLIDNGYHILDDLPQSADKFRDYKGKK